MRLSFEEKFFFHVSKNALLLRDGKQTLTMPDIVSLVCGKFNLSISEIKSKSQKGEVVLPRQIAMYLIKTHLGLSEGKIGLCFLKDRCTVKHAIKTIVALRSNYSIHDKNITQIEGIIKREFV